MAGSSGAASRAGSVAQPPCDPHIAAMSDISAACCISLNGEARALSEPTTVAALLATLGLDRRKVAVECNEAIVPRSVYDTTRLQDGDKLEIVHFIGGG